MPERKFGNEGFAREMRGFWFQILKSEFIGAGTVGQVASDILRRGGWIKISQLISPIKNSIYLSIPVINFLNNEFLKYWFK